MTTTQTAATAKREYKLAAYPVQSGPQKGRREILEITEDDHREVILVVAQDDAMDVRDALACAYQDGREDNAAMLDAEGRLRTEAEMRPVTREGTRVRLIDPPGSKVPYGAVGVAEGPPLAGGLFWVQFPQGRMDVRVSEVEIVRDDAEPLMTTHQGRPVDARRNAPDHMRGDGRNMELLTAEEHAERHRA